MVRVHAVETDRAAGAVDFQPQLVFAAGGELGRLDRPQAPDRIRASSQHAVFGIDRRRLAPAPAAEGRWG